MSDTDQKASDRPGWTTIREEDLAALEKAGTLNEAVASGPGDGTLLGRDNHFYARGFKAGQETPPERVQRSQEQVHAAVVSKLLKHGPLEWDDNDAGLIADAIVSILPTAAE